MLRRIININEELCNGCGACANACHEGAIEMVDGKAKLIRDDYCDGLGDCLPACPTGAISFQVREAAAYDEAAVKAHMESKAKTQSLPCGCPGMHSKSIKRNPSSSADNNGFSSESRLMQWPVQIRLVPVNAPYFENSNLLIAADCTAYAYGDFHNKFFAGKIALIGCPKLDDEDYAEKLGEILRNNNILSVTVVRMEVPCCGGIEHSVRRALEQSGKEIPLSVFTLTTTGKIIDSISEVENI